ncbi:MAG TPA: hypothetical protein VD794_04770 [Flavisolibacter sp.]|nr:hypothetical protein [Flavisolibacter sp.]
MKILKTGALCVLLHALALSSNAQNNLPLSEPDYNKPKLFDDLPSKFPLDVKLLELLLDLPIGQSLAIPLTKGLRYQGVVVSKSDASDPNLKSIVIKSTNRGGAIFNFTRLRNEDGSNTYMGRILSHKHGDAFEIEFEDGQYILNKKQLYDLFNE